MNARRPYALRLVSSLALLLLCGGAAARAGDLTVDNLNVLKQSSLYGPLVVHGPFTVSDVSTNGLVLYYSFNTNTTPVPDDSGNGNTGTVNGATWTTNGVTGGAYDFDGNNDYMSVPHNNLFNFSSNDFSITFWAYLDTVDGEEIISKSHSTSYGPFRILSSSGNWGWLFDSDTQPQKIAELSITPASTNTWSHMVVTRSGTNVYMWLNNQLVKTTAMAFTLGDNTQPINIGRNPYSSGTYYVNGRIDGLLIYNRSLSTNEIQTLYLSGIATHPDAGSVTFSKGVIYTYPLGDLSMGVYTNNP